MGTPEKFPAYVVRAAADDRRADNRREVAAGVEQLAIDDLPAGEVVIEVAWSSLNYKDALACRGHQGVVRVLPHVPGIDCAGRVVESTDASLAAGQRVLVTGCGLGSDYWGGYSGRVRVPADWVVALPEGLTERDAMVYGTAGFTAAQSVDALLRHGLTPGDGPVLVTGATGGVGVLTVAILAKLGFEVVAMTGKASRHGVLTQVGASRITPRDALAAGGPPLLKSAYAGGVDTVGGDTLAGLIRSTRYRGVVACCGLVGGPELSLTVYPFILRGVTLAGIDSAKCPREPRLKIWERLAGEWSVTLPDELVTTIDLDGLPARVEEILAGSVAGRTLVVPASNAHPTN